MSELTVSLDHGSLAPRVARRAVRTALREWGLEELEDEVALLVSELTTNALLHAGGAHTMRLARLPTGVRVEVCDPSRLMPQRRHYDAEATTGRGLALVAAIASRAGAEARGDGKCIWFEIDRSDEAQEDAVIERVPADESLTGHVPVRLLSLPVALYRASQQQIEALLREFVIEAWASPEHSEAGVAGAPADGALAAGALAAGALAAGPLLAGGLPLAQADLTDAANAHSAVAAEIGRYLDPVPATGEGRIDVEVALPRKVTGAVRALSEILDEADARAARCELLSRPTLPELRALRTWYLGEIGRQLGGGPPRPWTGSTLVERAGEQLPPVTVDWDELEVPLSAAVVAGDEGNRIVAVTVKAAEMLGWDAEALAGERIVTIVPHRLRERHLAGFTRFLATGERHLLGTTVSVPALRADGTEVQVTLRLESRALDSGRALFLAWFQEPHP